MAIETFKKTAVKNYVSGFKTSEFWLSLAVIVLPIGIPLLQESVGKLPTGGWQGALGACVLAGVYALSRSLVKIKAQEASGSTESLLNSLQDVLPSIIEATISGLNNKANVGVGTNLSATSPVVTSTNENPVIQPLND